MSLRRSDLVAKSRDWQTTGANIFGGCCGIGPDHIAALSKEFKLMKTGSCLCGGVTFEMRGPLKAITACHCTQCRKQTGNLLGVNDKR